MDNINDQSSQDSSVVEMNNSTSVLLKIANLYAEQLMSDIILVVDNVKYPAHRVILCASSEVFQVMLMNPEWNECRESEIELKEDPLCSKVFPHFLKYLYVGQVKVSIQTVMPMLALADKYNIKDLVQLCVDYMLKHIAKAATQGYLVSWLQYAINFSSDHQEVTEACKNFIKWNLNIVANSTDFVDFDVNLLILLLQQNDLVINSEYELFGYIEKWLLHKNEQITKEITISNDEKITYMLQILEAVIVHIRFPMMTPTEISNLLIRPIVALHKLFFIDRITIGMCYHSGQDERILEVRNTDNGALQFTPRLYTTDTWSLSMTVENFERIENYENFAANFFSQSNLSEYQEADRNIAWEVDFYPRGIRFRGAKLIDIFNLQGNSDIPETILKTVRLRVACRDNLDKERRFQVCVLITGVQKNIPYIKTVHVRLHYFSNINRVLNIDNLIPYDELALSSIQLSPHLIGDDRNQLKINLLITPMGPYICHETPSFDMK